MDTQIAKIPAELPAEARTVWLAILRGDDFFGVRAEFARQHPGGNFEAACAAASDCFASTAEASETERVMRGFILEGFRQIYREAMAAQDLPTALRALGEMAKTAGLR